jgi:uncharacterized membrane protein
LSESEENVVVLRERLQSAVGLHGQLLVYMIPSLALLIGEQPAVEVDLGMSELHALYNQLFVKLIDVFSRYHLCSRCLSLSLSLFDHRASVHVQCQARLSVGDVLG